MNIKAVQIHQLSKKHLRQQINPGCRYKICEGSILKYQKRQDVDAFVYDRQTEKHLQVQRRASCRYIGLKKSICNSEYQALQIHQLSKKHLRQRINREYRYIRFQKSKSFIIPPISITIHHKARKRLCNPANWSRACPTKLSRSA